MNQLKTTITIFLVSCLPHVSASSQNAAAPLDTELESHRGTVAFFGPLYFQERFYFSRASSATQEAVVSKSLGVLAGSSVEYQWKWLSLNLDFAMLGAVSSLQSEAPDLAAEINTRSILFGALLRPKILLRLGRLDIGPTFPIVARWIDYSSTVYGTPDTPNFKSYLSAGAHISYDFGSFRLGSDWALLDFKHPVWGLTFQFEL